MKKYKIYFSLFNLFHESQAEVVRLQTILKGISATAIGTTYAMSNEHFALLVAVSAGIADALLSCFWFEEIK